MGASALEIKEKDKDSIKALIEQNEKRYEEAGVFFQDYNKQVAEIRRKQDRLGGEMGKLMVARDELNELLK